MKQLLAILVLVLSPLAALGNVTTQNYSVTYSCTGSTGPYSFTFPVSDPTTLTVTQAGVLLNPSVYTITPVNNNYENGGNVTLNVACSSGTLVLARVTPLTQGTVFTDNMPIPMKTIERSFDKLTEIAQEQAGDIGSLATWSCPGGLVATGLADFLPQCTSIFGTLGPLPFLDVRNYGGSIQATVTAAIAGGGGTVFMPCGTFNLPTAVVASLITSSVDLLGSGKCTLLNVNGTSNEGLSISGTVGITRAKVSFRNFAMTSNTSGTSAALIHLTGISNFDFENLWLDGNSKATNSIQFTGAQQGELHGGFITGSTVNVLLEDSATVGSDSIEIHGESISASVVGSTDIKCINSTIDVHDNHLTGIPGGTSTLVDIDANCDGSVHSNSTIEGYQYAIKNAGNRLVFTNNSFFPTGGATADIYITSGFYNRIGPSNRIQAGIKIDSGAKATQIFENQLADAGTYTDNGVLSNWCFNRGELGNVDYGGTCRGNKALELYSFDSTNLNGDSESAALSWAEVANEFVISTKKSGTGVNRSIGILPLTGITFVPTGGAFRLQGSAPGGSYFLDLGTVTFRDSDGSAGGSVVVNALTASAITNGKGIQMLNSTTTCTTGASIGATCTTAAITLPVAYADTNYRLNCTGLTPTNVPIVETYAKSNTTFTITVAALTAAAATFTSFDCVAGHN